MAIDNAYYEQQRRGIRSGTARELATNAYARFLARQRGTRERSDLRTDYRQGRQDYGTAYNRNIQNFNTDFARYGQDRGLAYQRGYAPMAAQYGARGLNTGGVTSGVANQGINEYRGNYARDIHRAETDYERAMHRNQFDYGRSMGRLTHGFNTQLGRSRVNTAQEMNQFDLSRADIQAQRSEALAMLQAQRAKERAMTAQYLTALRPYLG